MKKVKAVIFDLDGLLIDSEKVCYQLYQDLIKPYGHYLSLEEYAQNYSGKTGVTNMNTIIERFHLPITLQEGLDWTFEKEKEYLEAGIDLKPGVKELLKYLRDNQYKIMLASSSVKERAIGILKSHQIEDYFQEMVFGPEFSRGKPYPDIFLKACEKIGEKPEDCLVLEDSEAGVQAAYSANIPVICVPDMKQPGEKYAKMPVRIVGSLLDVIEYLE